VKADVFRRRRTGAAWLALPAAAVLLAGCKPGAVGGYDKIVYRDDARVPQAAFPDPPPVTPGASAGGSAVRIVATNLPQGLTQAMVDEGQDLYGTVCAACHGQNGTGSAAAPALNDAQWLNISGQYPEIVAIINSGVPAPKQFPGVMPPRGGGSFDDAQVSAIAAYVFALSHQEGA
jgi:mono/diheme cytochrome c family protein